MLSVFDKSSKSDFFHAKKKACRANPIWTILAISRRERARRRLSLLMQLQSSDETDLVLNWIENTKKTAWNRRAKTQARRRRFGLCGVYAWRFMKAVWFRILNQSNHQQIILQTLTLLVSKKKHWLVLQSIRLGGLSLETFDASSSRLNMGAESFSYRVYTMLERCCVYRTLSWSWVDMWGGEVGGRGRSGHFLKFLRHQDVQWPHKAHK